MLFSNPSIGLSDGFESKFIWTFSDADERLDEIRRNPESKAVFQKELKVPDDPTDACASETLFHSLSHVTLVMWTYSLIFLVSKGDQHSSVIHPMPL